MTPVYEVRTKHTKKMLEDFLKFRENARNTKITFRIVMLAVCSATLMYIGRNQKTLFTVFTILTVLFLLLAIIRRPLGVYRLSKADEAYQKQSELHFVFGESEFRLDNQGTGELTRMKYGEVAFMYSDDVYFYINVNNEDLHMLPKADFTLGTAEGFYDFFMQKTGKSFQMVKLPWKMKIGILKQALAETQEEKSGKNGKNK